ncbi:hypothetical protein TNCV_2944771 [Trichonephila clavipes]|nr:hypothetical protein TNCV_2944771 [Trichonephila clavipes]
MNDGSHILGSVTETKPKQTIISKVFYGQKEVNHDTISDARASNVACNIEANILDDKIVATGLALFRRTHLLPMKQVKTVN